MVTTSRRSPAVLSRAVGELAAADPRVRAWRGAHDEGGSAANPYLEFLATADHVVVTADSVNMVTEAVAAAHFTAAVVHVALDDACDTPPPMPQALLGRGSRRRLESFLKYLFDHQAAVPFEPARPFEREADVPRGGRQLQRDIAEQPARIARAVFGKAEAEAARSL
jgi:mitochondrial fission protein ELM1